MPDEEEDTLKRRWAELDAQRSLQKKSPSYLADALLERKRFGPDNINCFSGEEPCGKFLNNIASNHYREDDYLMHLPVNNAGIENYAKKLLDVLNKIRDMAKHSDKQGKKTYTESPQEILPQLSPEELSLLKAAPKYFEGLETLAQEQLRQARAVAADPVRRVKEVEKDAQRHADFMRGVIADTEHLKKVKEEGGDMLRAIVHESKFDEPAPFGAEEYRQGDNFVRNYKPNFLWTVTEALPAMAEDARKINEALAAGRGGSVRVSPRSSRSPGTGI